jgi:hypothetical protein
MYVNVKMIPVETNLGMGVKESGGGEEFKCDVFNTFKNSCKCHNVSTQYNSKKVKVEKKHK